MLLSNRDDRIVILASWLDRIRRGGQPPRTHTSAGISPSPRAYTAIGLFQIRLESLRHVIYITVFPRSSNPFYIVYQMGKYFMGIEYHLRNHIMKRGTTSGD